ncbi:hypothetical protein ADIARSV_3071 [Arcticibacter svalbardensis MN12-7]|uniref:Transcriptional regulator, AbiEi antitoxin, Type IV TA system n=1 Tax=Arcticibacter svalbardensis MN12-7 TaxID=1150600 RepID=R9GPU5_9SPHI|nr:DUF6088 family protein [Arcticibacter svalbardensis]EOR93731.1 hypothetical protein ADIARSV_3071 [Arcticibacter svalbardensis MN12-7]
MKSVQQEISGQISAFQPGTIVFPTEFRGVGTDDAVRQALSRLAKEDKIERLAHGIYFLPKIHPTFGKLYPSMEEVAEAVAAHEHMRIRPAGAYALNKLGLSTQVPARLVYITDGQARQIKIGKGGIKFKPVTPKKFGMKGPISSLLIQGLEEMNTSQVTLAMEDRIKDLLSQETPDNLNYDLKLAPARISDYIIKLLKYPLNGRVA